MSTPKEPTKKPQKGQGGKRENAGRKPAYGERGITSSITMPQAAWDMLDALCGPLGRSGWIIQQILKADIKATQCINKMSP